VKHGGFAGALLAVLAACTPAPVGKPDGGRARPEPAPAPPRKPGPWAKVAALDDGQTLALHLEGARAQSVGDARASGLLDVDLGDEWAPFIFSESDGAGAAVLPNPYRKTFVDLANDRVDPDELSLLGGATRAIDLSPEAVERRRLEDEARRHGKPLPPPPPPKPRPPLVVRNFLEVYGIPPTL